MKARIMLACRLQALFFGALVIVLVVRSVARADPNGRCCKYTRDCQGCQLGSGGKYVDVGYNSWHRCKESKSEDFCEDAIAAEGTTTGPGVCYHDTDATIYTSEECTGTGVQGTITVLKPYCSWDPNVQDPPASKCPLET